MSADAKSWYSASELARLGAVKAIDMPGTERNARDKARRLSWPTRSIEGGGGAGGMRTDYQPPADVLAQINAFLALNPDFFDRSKKSGGDRSYQANPVEPLVSGSGQHNGLKFNNHAQTIQKAIAMAITPGTESHTAEVVESLLVVCLKACAKVYGEPFQAQDAAVQLGYAADLYNLLVRMSAAMGGNMELMQRLELDGVAQQLQLFIKIGQARKFPPPPDFMSVMW